MDDMCLHNPQASNRRVAWSIIRRLSTKKWKGHFFSPQHCDQRGSQRDHPASVHERRDRDDLGGGNFLGGWNGGGLVRDGGLIEGEEDCAEENRGLFVGIGLEARVDVDYEGGTDGGEQTHLQGQFR